MENMNNQNTRQPAGLGGTGGGGLDQVFKPADSKIKVYTSEDASLTTQRASILDSNSKFISNDIMFWISLLFTVVLLGILISRIISTKK